ncbi:archease [Thermodesulfobacterium sp. TA1]|uniref:archease n=1 Tax=Thermodesulfobacterium sp. TA1 TaxID=2234087 RepID=UPI001232C954|nr:archease [Thermodesulfobacterium sp. TA1]QER42353.1 archease [Thermodesulfobacterium sp. TA1]
MLSKEYETFEHGADIGIRGYGKTLEEAFSNLLKALFSLIGEEVDFERVKAQQKIEIKLASDFLDELVVIFINKVLSLFALENIFFKEFKGKIEETEQGVRLDGVLLGEDYSPDRFGCGVEVKGATFTLAKVEKKDDLWIAQCVVDV